LESNYLVVSVRSGPLLAEHIGVDGVKAFDDVLGAWIALGLLLVE